MKVMVACGCGMGSSQMLKMKAEQLFRKLGIPATIEHTSIEFAKSEANKYDVVIINEQFLKDFKKTTAKVIGLKNILSTKEMEEILRSAGVIE